MGICSSRFKLRGKFDSSWVYTALTRFKNTMYFKLENYKKSFVSDDLNLIDVDKVVIDHEVKSEKEQNITTI